MQAFLSNIQLLRRLKIALIGLLVSFAAVGAAAFAEVSPGAVMAAAPPSGQPITALGVHGMTVFGGREALYAGHLPMFHPPHDTQVIVRFHLADAAQDAALRSELALRPRLWTLEPKLFDLLRLAPDHVDPLRRFEATLFEGHFERGGIKRFAGQTVVIDEILAFRRLDPSPRAGSIGDYHLVGRGREWFAFKQIDRRPDFDHLLALNAPRGVRSADLANKVVHLAGIGLSQPSPKRIEQALRRQLGNGWRVRRDIYFETDDLQ